ncbi:MAG: L-threonylcarbamoyladenylate synthase [Gemmatimonadota bacterium]
MPASDSPLGARIPVLPADDAGIGSAVQALRAGRLILHPTETVVSLAGDPYRDDAAEAAWRLKGYDAPRPFLCLVPDPAAARALAAEWPEAAERLAEAFWPGPLTLVVGAAEGAPAAVAVDGTLALRPGCEPVSCALLAAWGGPLLSTSANRRGEPAPTRVEDAAAALGSSSGAEAIALALAPTPEGLLSRRGGKNGGTYGSGVVPGQPSTIIDVTRTPRLVRVGAIPLDQLRRILPGLD